MMSHQTLSTFTISITEPTHSLFRGIVIDHEGNGPPLSVGVGSGQ